jgi:alpha-L-rhamnosidase
MKICAPEHLRCEYLPNPLGVTMAAPRFSWILSSDRRGDRQSAYQIIVASELEIAQREIGDVWDSGRVESERNFQVPYAGEPFQSSTKYFWQVRWWDLNGGASPFSPTVFFVTGLLKEKDWKAKWISKREHRVFRTKGTVILGEHRGEYIQSHAIYFRQDFEVKPGVKRAIAHICGLGYYELRLNGKKVGDAVLEPAQTDYNKAALYSTYDLTELIQTKNAIGVVVGNGRMIKSYGYDQPKLIAQIEIEYENGGRERLVTDDSWKVAFGPLTENGIYSGEKYDAREEQPGWDEANFEDYSWGERAVTVQGPPVDSRLLPPIRVTGLIRPKSLASPEPDVHLFDFGQNFAGWARLRVQGPRGATVSMRYAELRHEDGTLNTSSNQNAEARDVYVLRGGGSETYEPRFTYHGFRYLELKGFPGEPTLDSVEGCLVHTDVPPAGDFSCSHPLINQIHQNVLWGQKSNLMSIPTDCPQRDERHGWLGDAHLAAEEAILNFDMAAFYTKYLEDIRLAQKEDGSLPDTVPPYFGHLYPADPAWGSAYIILAWNMYQFYEDKKILERHFLPLKKYIEFLRANAEGHILKKLGKYGDWCPPGSIGPKKTPLELTSTWFYYHDVAIFSKIAQVLARNDDFRSYGRLAEEIKEAFNKAFLGEEEYKAVHISAADRLTNQTSNILPLYLEMVPAGKKAKVIARLLHGLEQDQDFHLDTGIIGTRYLFDVLTQNGAFEAAFRTATQASYPGFGYMIAEGATTLWERWEKLTRGGMNSHNHIMLGSIDAWFYRAIAGLRCLEPGWKRILVNPPLFDGLRSATAAHETPRGEVSVEWERGDNSLQLAIAVPVGAEAEIRLSLLAEGTTLKEGGTVLWENGKPSQSQPEISVSATEGGCLVISIPSGQYRFSLTK